MDSRNFDDGELAESSGERAVLWEAELAALTSEDLFAAHEAGEDSADSG